MMMPHSSHTQWIAECRKRAVKNTQNLGRKRREKTPVLLPETKRCETVRKAKAEVHGNRRSPENAGIFKDSDSHNTNYDTDRVNVVELDADLQAIIERWNEMPDAVKAGILAMVLATGSCPVNG